jgi:hypothetical protein
MAKAKSKLEMAKKAASKLKTKKKSASARYQSQGQNPPQSKAWTEPSDESVVAKPVGYRWTTLGAKRLGKKESTKPSATEIEKYKNKTFSSKGESHRYLYSEKRVDKSDKVRSAKFKEGGSVKQTSPQSDAYKKSNDKKVEAKPVGWRYKGNNYNEPSDRVINREKKKSREDRSIYFEKRKDKSDHDFYAKLEDGGTTGAGSFKKGGKTKELELLVDSNRGVYVPQVFVENYDLKEFGFNDKDIAYFKKAFSDPSSDDYFDAYEEMESKAITKDGSTITTADGDLWLVPKGYEYDDFFYGKDGRMMAKGGKISEMDYIGSLNDSEDAVNAKKDLLKTGDFNEIKIQKVKQANQLNKYSRRNESYYFWRIYVDIKDNVDYMKNSNKWRKIIEKNNTYEGRHKSYEDGGNIDYKTYLHINKKNESDVFPLIDDGYYVKLSKHKEVFLGGQIFKDGMTKTEAINFAKDLMSRWNIPDENLIIDEEWRVNQFADGGMMAKGGATFGGRQYDPYNKDMDGQKQGKPIGYRFTDALAKRLGRNAHSRPTQAEVEKYLGRGIYFENRQDKSDAKPSSKYISLEDGGTMGAGSYKSGGATFGGRQYNPYNKSMDGEKTGKPVGYRFTDKLAKRLGKSVYAKPTSQEIQKYLGRGVYFENRQDKSDMKPTTSKTYASFERGGMARGGVERISNAESRTYTENMIPFQANNLEGKTLSNGDYVVLSYGYYPIWWYCKGEGKWYGNSTKYSVTTSKHMSQSRPTYDATMLSRDELEKAMMKHSAKFESGGMLDNILADTDVPADTIGGTSFSSADLTSQMDITNPAF